MKSIASDLFDFFLEFLDSLHEFGKMQDRIIAAPNLHEIPGGITRNLAVRRKTFRNAGLGSDKTVVADFDMAYEARLPSDQDPIADPGASGNT